MLGRLLPPACTGSSDRLARRQSCSGGGILTGRWFDGAYNRSLAGWHWPWRGLWLRRARVARGKSFVSRETGPFIRRTRPRAVIHRSSRSIAPTSAAWWSPGPSGRGTNAFPPLNARPSLSMESCISPLPWFESLPWMRRLERFCGDSILTPTGLAVTRRSGGSSIEAWSTGATTSRPGFSSRSKIEARIFFTFEDRLYALDAADGSLIPSFGDRGTVNLRLGLDRPTDDLPVKATSPGVIFRDLLILGSTVGEGPGPAAPGHIRAYDVRSGERIWICPARPTW